MTKKEVQQAIEMRGIQTWNRSHRNCARRLYYTALRTPYEPLSTDQKIVMKKLRMKYKRQLIKYC